MKIVTGLGKAAHITSNDALSFQQGLIGTGDSYALNVGNKFKTELASNNELKIYDGEGVLQGVHFRVLPGSYDSVTLENGSQGMKRKDLVVARYTKDSSTGIENVEWIVKKGTPTSGTPTAPTATSGAIRESGASLAEAPWFLVEYDGLTVKSVTAQFTVIKTAEEIQKMLPARIYATNVSLSYASATEMTGYAYCGARVLQAVACIEVGTNTPYKQVTATVVEVGAYNVSSRVQIHAYGSGFVSGHVLKASLICLTQ